MAEIIFQKSDLKRTNNSVKFGTNNGVKFETNDGVNFGCLIRVSHFGQF
jgi:hypothetical protein